MAEKRRSLKPEQMTEDELVFWRGCARTALPDCLSIKNTPDFCAHITSEVADAMVREYRKRKARLVRPF